jgi:hypothetical protein
MVAFAMVWSALRAGTETLLYLNPLWFTLTMAPPRRAFAIKAVELNTKSMTWPMRSQRPAVPRTFSTPGQSYIAHHA